MMAADEARKYDPKYAHEYYLKHRKLKGRKKGKKKKSGSKKKISDALAIRVLEEDASKNKKFVAAVEKEKIAQERKEAVAKVKKKYAEIIKSMKEQIDKATPEELEPLKNKLAELMVDYQKAKQTIKAFYLMKYMARLKEIIEEGKNNDSRE